MVVVHGVDVPSLAAKPAKAVLDASLWFLVVAVAYYVLLGVFLTEVAWYLIGGTIIYCLIQFGDVKKKLASRDVKQVSCCKSYFGFVFLGTAPWAMSYFAEMITDMCLLPCALGVTAHDQGAEALIGPGVAASVLCLLELVIIINLHRYLHAIGQGGAEAGAAARSNGLHGVREIAGAQWAARVLSASSQYDANGWSYRQAAVCMRD